MPFHNKLFRRAVPVLAENGAVCALALMIGIALKVHYSTAGVDGLLWMLVPLSHLVGLITGIGFEYDASGGFVSLPYRVVRRPARGSTSSSSAFPSSSPSFIGGWALPKNLYGSCSASARHIS